MQAASISTHKIAIREVTCLREEVNAFDTMQITTPIVVFIARYMPKDFQFHFSICLYCIETT